MDGDPKGPSWGDEPAPPKSTTVADLIAALSEFPPLMPVAVGFAVWDFGEWWIEDTTLVKVDTETAYWPDRQPTRTRVIIRGECDSDGDDVSWPGEPTRWGLTPGEIAASRPSLVDERTLAPDD